MKGATVLAAGSVDGAAAMAADLIAGYTRAAIAQRGGAVIALSGGSTPWPAYRRLAAATDLDWNLVAILQVDEREVPPDHPDSNLAGIVEALGPRVSPQVIPLNGRAEAAGEVYRRIIERAGGIDVVALGIGDDGHTASLVPTDPVLECVDVVGRTQPYRGHRRLTLTYPAIDGARLRVVLAHGESKRRALRWALAGERPAGRVTGRSTLLVTTSTSL